MRTIGIDLGTTNTVAAIEATVLRHSVGLDESAIVPSIVAYPPSGATLVGVTAKGRRAIDPRNTIASAKRLMGQRWLSYAATRFRKQYGFDLRETDQGGCVFITRAGELSPQQIASEIIRKLFASMPAMRRSTHAVITVPAGFESSARTATTEGAALAGLESVSIVEEPVATALAYSTLRNARAGRAVVYDLGGGTFDLAVVDCQATPPKVLCHAGDAYLGGDDLDFALAEWAADEVLRRHNWDLRSSSEVFDRLLLQCERVKVELTRDRVAEIELAHVDPAVPHAAETVELTRDLLDDLSRSLVQRTFLLCDEALHAAGLTARSIDAVYLAGGASQLPVVRESVGKYFSSLPICEFDPMEVVAVGASLLPPP